MRKFITGLALAAMAGAVVGAERTFDFGKFTNGESPPGFRSTVSGQGKPGDWRIIPDEGQSPLPPLTPNSSGTTKRAVLAQLARDGTDEHFPLLIFEEEAFGDFTLTVRFKTVEGVVEQMAGIAFRIQDEKNYYVVRASSLGNNFRFYKMVDGQRSAPIGPEVEIPRKVWHELTIECTANQIRLLLNGKEAIPPLIDNSFNRGKFGIWTKSDSVSYFADLHLNYVPLEILAKTLAREALQKNPRLLGLRIYAKAGNRPELRVIASSDETELGLAAEKLEEDVVARDTVYFGQGIKSALVTLPLHDRNGEAVAAVRLKMKPFPGQTEQNAIVRALPIVKNMEKSVRSAKDLAQ